MSEITATAQIEVAGRTPSNVLCPGSLAELKSMVAAGDGSTLVPVGGGRLLGLGAPPAEPFDVVMLRQALRGPIEHQADDLTVVAAAGCTLGEIDAVLAERGQRLPIDPPLAPDCTLGGALAAAVSGPLRTRFGPPRDLVLGMTTLRADGELVRAGGRVVKNVTGYDLMRLWCGSLGTLGIITEAALRVYPVVPSVDLRVPVASLDDGVSLAERLYRADIRPEMADVLSDGTARHLAIRVPEAAASAARDLLGGGAAVAEPGADYLRSRDAGYGPVDGLLLSVVTTPSLAGPVAARLQTIKPSLLLVRPLVPVVRAAWRDDELPDATEFAAQLLAIREDLAEGRGSATVERMPRQWHEAVDAWGLPRSGLGIMQRLKAAYDPAGRLNRGRFAGGI